MRIIVAAHSFHPSITYYATAIPPPPTFIKLAKIEKQKNQKGKKKIPENTTQVLLAQSWKCFLSSLCEQMSVFSPAAVCQR